ncbi:D-2-hydroxyacid dehydrogenase [Paenibacillus allorhizosphaerae]|uniref:Hydroxypyruvate reductase n=1 Tax=Paenibacillus allorhizosphaerae TaxID=2849866 RepID=A0ABN7TYI8_9BACL|nr:D-2-hydroxyacid dehydrogenase [Paenibacillus allorhizosphaerae]CAG7657293.1 Hydroxypyruvate reductase [Paenibacillus allorhizosphaerae]
MNIVVLDGYTLNPGDLSWSALEQLGTVTLHDRTPEHEVVSRASEADIVLTNKTPLSAASIAQLPKLRYIGVLATGYNIVDIEAAAKRGIVVANVPSYSTYSVAQLVFALLLELCHRVGRHDDAVKSGAWAASPDFCFTRAPLIELAGKTIGLIGLGRIGRQTARIALAMGMRVVAVGSGRTAPTPEEGVEWVTLPELLQQADVVSLHCPLTPATQGLINRERIAWMKPTAMLINTSRGPLIVEDDLAAALREQRIQGAGLDVLAAEPPRADNPLLALPNCIVTPHIAWATKEARVRLMDTAVANLAAFLAGKPVHVVGG